MKSPARRIGTLFLALFMVASLAGCMTSVEELYSLPQVSEEYVQLQELIAQRIDAGSAYAAPTGGRNRQSIQLRDLDGDGSAEALAFLVDETRTPTVCVYRRDDEGAYYPFVIITGYGSAVASVDYADLTGDGSTELIIVWQGVGDIRLLTVHSLGGPDRADQRELLSVDCTDFLVCDLNGDGVDDLVDLHLSGEQNMLDMYDLTGEEPASSSAALSDGVTALAQAASNRLADGTAAVFVDCELGSQGLVTDVFTAADGQLRNITMTPLGRSNTLRPDGLYAADLDDDGVLELPMGGESDALQWYALDADGGMTPALTTYYSASDGWYLVLTGPLAGELIPERSIVPGQESSVVFNVAGDETTPQRSVLIISTLTGENRLDRAESGGRFLLQQTDSVVYAAQLLTDELTEQDIRDNFYLLYAEWQTGDL